ncbi:hypothetical protein SAMN03159341_11675 [Paenibacillus sp. 1_12]|nr:hypothetical protein SAMN03159341_11675 [Paenibacillus sp. 1_12]
MIAFDLPFLYHMHDFDSGNCFLCSTERLESQHWFYDFLCKSMILFNYIVQIFLLS